MTRLLIYFSDDPWIKIHLHEWAEAWNRLCFLRWLGLHPVHSPNRFGLGFSIASISMSRKVKSEIKGRQGVSVHGPWLVYILNRVLVSNGWCWLELVRVDSTPTSFPLFWWLGTECNIYIPSWARTTVSCMSLYLDWLQAKPTWIRGRQACLLYPLLACPRASCKRSTKVKSIQRLPHLGHPHQYCRRNYQHCLVHLVLLPCQSCSEQCYLHYITSSQGVFPAAFFSWFWRFLAGLFAFLADSRIIRLCSQTTRLSGYITSFFLFSRGVIYGWGIFSRMTFRWVIITTAPSCPHGIGQSSHPSN